MTQPRYISLGDLTLMEHNMNWLTAENIREFLTQKNYDIRISNNARWLDQKCASDVVTIVADCILHFAESHPNAEFSSVDIWHDTYTVQNVESFFKKPNPDEKKARNEYDKFFQQPMEMLAYAGVLGKRKQGNRNCYSIVNESVLAFIALRERNALLFLTCYVEKVMRDSGLWDLFEQFFAHEDKASYKTLKNGFADFIINNTPINGRVECFRIFIKVLNPLSYYFNKRGTEGGRISAHQITYDMLMYNRDNFRDLYSNKPKGMTRKEYVAQTGITVNTAYTNYISQKAKRFLRMFNDAYRDGKTELYDERHINDVATHMHHIFPEANFPEICGYIENLIALTPTQHLNYAHPLGNTQMVDTAFQHTLLLAKISTIEENLSSKTQDKIYEFSRMTYVLFVGFDNDIFKEIGADDFPAVIHEVNRNYA